MTAKRLRKKDAETDTGIEFESILTQASIVQKSSKRRKKKQQQGSKRM